MLKAETEWMKWLYQVACERREGNPIIESQRGQEIARVALEEAKRAFSWRRDDPESFWLDVYFFTYYGFDDSQVRFVCRTQPGLDNWKENADERNAYAEMMRGMNKLKKLLYPEIFDPVIKWDEQDRLFEEKMTREITEKFEIGLYGKLIVWSKHDYGYMVMGANGEPLRRSEEI